MVESDLIKETAPIGLAALYPLASFTYKTQTPTALYSETIDANTTANAGIKA